MITENMQLQQHRIFQKLTHEPEKCTPTLQTGQMIMLWYKIVGENTPGLAQGKLQALGNECKKIQLLQ